MSTSFADARPRARSARAVVGRTRPAGAALTAGAIMVDVAALGAALAVALGLRGSLLDALRGPVAEIVTPAGLPVFAAIWLAIHVVVLRWSAPSGMRLGGTWVDDLPAIARGVSWGALVDLVTSFAVGVPTPRGLITVAWVIALAVVPVARSMETAVRRRVLASSVDGVPTVVVGTGAVAAQAAEEILRHPESGLRLSGTIGPEPVPDVPWLGGIDRLPLHLGPADEVVHVIVASAADVGEPLVEALWGRPAGQCRISLVAQHSHLLVPRGGHDQLGSLVLLHAGSGRTRRLARAMRGAFDRAAAALVLLLTAPILLGCALAIMLESPGNPLFRQQRVGLHGRSFRIVKLRTMVPDAEALRASLVAVNEADGPLFKVRRDPRITRVGRLLRRTSVDELPQLWNVLRGQMSLVGPRPPLAEEVELYPAWFRRRLSVKPGITGLWQVSGRATIPFADAMRLDLAYVEGWSPLLDLQILLRTVGAVVGGRGAC